MKIFEPVNTSQAALEYTYNAAKRLQSETSFGRTVGFLYDAVYNRTRLTHPDSQYIQYDYDNLNRVWKCGRTAPARAPACWRPIRMTRCRGAPT